MKRRAIGDALGSWNTSASSESCLKDIRLTLKPKEAAKALFVFERMLRKLIKAGKVPASKVNQEVLIPNAELEAIIERDADSANRVCQCTSKRG